MTNEEKKKRLDLLYSDSGPGRREEGVFGLVDRRTLDSKQKDIEINIRLRKARAAMRDALRNAPDYADIPQEKYMKILTAPQVIEGEREFIKGDRADELSTKSRSGLDRRSRRRRLDDPTIRSVLAEAFQNKRITSPVTVVGGKREGDLQWLFNKRPRLVDKKNIDVLYEHPVFKKTIRAAKPIIKGGIIMDAILSGDVDPLDSEIAGDPEPGGEEALFDAEMRGESAANLAIQRRKLAEQLARTPK